MARRLRPSGSRRGCRAVGRGAVADPFRRRLRRSGADLIDDGQQLADLHVLAFLALDAGDHAAALGVHLEVDLLGFELDDRLADLDAVALLLQPARDARLDDRFTEFRNDDIGHVS